MVFNSIGGLSGKKVFTDKDKKLSLFTLIFTHLQAVLGIVLYFLSPKVRFFENTMSNSSYRFFTVEHVFMMLIAIILITLGHRQAKAGNVKRVFWYYFIALVLILVSIPWPFRTDLGGAWF
jgi:hypothetical protein